MRPFERDDAVPHRRAELQIRIYPDREQEPEDDRKEQNRLAPPHLATRRGSAATTRTTDSNSTTDMNLRRESPRTTRPADAVRPSSTGGLTTDRPVDGSR